MPNSERPSRRVHRRLAALALASLSITTIAAPSGVAATDGDLLGPAPSPTRGGPPKGAGEPPPPEYTGRLIVRYADGVTAGDRRATRAAHGLSLVRTLSVPNTELVAPGAGGAVQALSKLDRSAEIESVEREQRLTQMGGPTFESRSAEQWALNNIGQTVGGYVGVRDVDMNVAEAWQITTGSPEVIVAVIDDGVDFSHPDLAEQAWVNPGEVAGNGQDDDGNGYIDDVNGWDFCHGDATVHDFDDAHGTHVAGSIAASSGSVGITGVAPGVKIMAVKFLGSTNDPTCGGVAGAVDAIAYAVEHGATIINASWGGSAPSPALEEALRAIPETLVVAAAGNANSNNDADPVYPASYDLPNVLSVASIHNQGHLTDDTNYGFYTVDLSAPGADIWSTVPGDMWERWSGTSMAAANASGVAALAVSEAPALADGRALRDHLIATARALPTTRGWVATPRLMDARAAVVRTPDLRRLAGGNRYDTAAAISAATFVPYTPYVFVATGAGFPDALAGGALAAQVGAPLLLTSRDSIPASTLNEIKRLRPFEIYVLGGTSVVSSSVLSQLSQYDRSTEGGGTYRLAGSNRFGTAVAISQAGFDPAYAPVPTAFIATGANFPDALSGVPAAAELGGPLLLVNPTSIPQVIKDELARLQPQQIVILGGTSVVSASVASHLDAYTTGSVTRWAGNNRFGTAAAVANGAFPTAETVFVANGLNFPDALAGGPAAGAYGGPLLLVTATGAPSQTLGQLNRLQPARIFVLGGTSVIPNAVVNQMKAVFD